MIKLENTEVIGWEHAIRGMRNPMNSWEKSDTEYKVALLTPGCYRNLKVPAIGPNDHDLMSKLAKGGPVHAKYRRMIVVYVDITAPLYWWKEFDTYKVGTVSNSCSTMHKIHEKEFALEDFSHEHLLGGLNHYDERQVPYLDFSPLRDKSATYSPAGILECVIIPMLNLCRERYLIALKTEEETGLPAKDIWWQMIQLLPSSYNQKRTIMLNYEVLVGMYRDRKNHKLDEWRDLCKWIEALPYSEIITGLKEEKKSMTNAERIRNMSVEEMAKLFCTEGMFLWDRDASDIADFKNWLQAEVEEVK